MSRPRASRPTIAVLLGVLAVTALSAGEVRRQVSEQKRQELQERSSEVALSLAAGLSEVRSALNILVGLPAGSTGPPTLFEDCLLIHI